MTTTARGRTTEGRRPVGKLGPPALKPVGLMYGVSAIDTQTAVAVGSSGSIVKTTNGGTTWTILDAGTSNSLDDVFFVNSECGWAVGELGTIVATTDGGESWVLQNSRIRDQLLDVFFVDENEGWVVGPNATILHTGDGGRTWGIQPPGVSGGLGGVFFADRRNGWVVRGSGYPGEGVVLTTSDGGEHWEPQAVELPAGGLASVFFVDGQTGWFGGGEEEKTRYRENRCIPNRLPRRRMAARRGKREQRAWRVFWIRFGTCSSSMRKRVGLLGQEIGSGPGRTGDDRRGLDMDADRGGRGEPPLSDFFRG